MGEADLLELTHGVGTKRKMDNLTEVSGGRMSKKFREENRKSMDLVKNEEEIRSGLDPESENDFCEEEIGSGCHENTQASIGSQENTQKVSQGCTTDENLIIDPYQATEPCENDPTDVLVLVDKFPDIESLDEEDTEYEDNVSGRTSEPDLVLYSERTSSEAELGIGYREHAVLYCKGDLDNED